MFGLLIYDWFLTLDAEMKCFWRGRWSISRILFLANRYLTPIAILLPLYSILMLRVYYLFSGSKLIQRIVVLCFIISVSVSLTFSCIAATNLRGLMPLVAFGIKGCRAERPEGFWRLYLPPLVLHTILYMLTVLRAARNRRMLKKSPVMQRLLKDGGFFYFVTVVSFGFSGIGSFMYNYPHINVPAIFSNFVLGITSVCVSRIMLSIQSLAASLGSDTAWLLNNVELSRVNWRHGAHEGELIVDLDPAYAEEEEYHRQDVEYDRRMFSSDLEMSDVKAGTPLKDLPGQPKQAKVTVRTTRVGTFGPMSPEPFSNHQSFLTLKSWYAPFNLFLFPHLRIF
ncbi:hypothetical protein ONZ45_g10446 [Pleurotus djamor]|nr:hypothetical protein ONZ45_g10446 [Pleurotus djamor]